MEFKSSNLRFPPFLKEEGSPGPGALLGFRGVMCSYNAVAIWALNLLRTRRWSVAFSQSQELQRGQRAHAKKTGSQISSFWQPVRVNLAEPKALEFRDMRDICLAEEGFFLAWTEHPLVHLGLSLLSQTRVSLESVDWRGSFKDGREPRGPVLLYHGLQGELYHLGKICCSTPSSVKWV